MFRGDWLKSLKGVMLAMTERMCVGATSTCVVRPGTISLRSTAMSMYACSNEPSISTAPSPRCTVGRIMRAGVEKSSRPGNAPAAATGTQAISSNRGTCGRRRATKTREEGKGAGANPGTASAPPGTHPFARLA